MWTKRLLAPLRRSGFDYSCFKVYSTKLDEPGARTLDALPDGYRCDEISPEELRKSPFPALRACEWYGGPGAYLYGLRRRDGVVTCLQCLWFGDRFREHGFWPLKDNDAASVHLETAEEDRGKGLATFLKQQTAHRMHERGFERLYSRIWWTNRSSLRVSEKAQWSHIATIVEVKLPWRARPLRFVLIKSRSKRR
jgi:RimJ/RimL family protein N-acetyltransferase